MASGPCCSGERGQPAEKNQSVHVEDLCLLIEECLCCFRTQLNVYYIVNVARTLLLG